MTREAHFVRPTFPFQIPLFGGELANYAMADGITAYTQQGHIARATLEATCFQTKAILEAMAKDSGKELAELAVDGGMSNSDLCMQVCPTCIHLYLFFLTELPLPSSPYPTPR